MTDNNQSKILTDHNPCSLCSINIALDEKWSLRVGGGGEGDDLFATDAAGDVFIFHDKCYEEHMASIDNK